MSLNKLEDQLKPKRYKSNQVPGSTFITRPYLQYLYGLGKSAMDSQLRLIEDEIKEKVPSFKLNGKKNFSIREQEVIFELLGNPLNSDI